MFCPELNSVPEKVELLQQNWGCVGGAQIQADSSNRRDGVGGSREVLMWNKETTGGLPKTTPFHHLKEANSRRHHEHCGDQTGRG